MTTSRLTRGLLGTTVLTLPVLVWIKDRGYGLYYVSGSSMEPTLRSGDVVLVRKINLPMGGSYDSDSDSRSNNKINLPIGIHNFPPNDDGNFERDLEDAYGRRREELLRPRQTRYQQQSSFSWWSWGSTPLVFPGQIIVFWSPSHFQQLCIKRVIGVGGQFVSQQTNVKQRLRHLKKMYIARNSYLMVVFVFKVLPRDFPTRLNLTTLTRRDLANYLVPPSYWYVEGDNADNSTDSRLYGPVPQRLLVGVVDRILWPLERAQPLPRNTACLEDNYPISRAWWQ